MTASAWSCHHCQAPQPAHAVRVLGASDTITASSEPLREVAFCEPCYHGRNRGRRGYAEWKGEE